PEPASSSSATRETSAHRNQRACIPTNLFSTSLPHKLAASRSRPASRTSHATASSRSTVHLTSPLSNAYGATTPSQSRRRFSPTCRNLRPIACWRPPEACLELPIEIALAPKAHAKHHRLDLLSHPHACLRARHAYPDEIRMRGLSQVPPERARQGAARTTHGMREAR